MLERFGLRKPNVEAKVRRIERETGIFTPEFISSLAPVDPVKASKLAFKLGLINKEHLIDRFGSLTHRGAQTIAAYEGLEYLRNNITETDKGPFSHLGLFERFNNPDLRRIESIARDEIARRKQRDQDILKMELSF